MGRWHYATFTAVLLSLLPVGAERLNTSSFIYWGSEPLVVMQVTAWINVPEFMWEKAFHLCKNPLKSWAALAVTHWVCVCVCLMSAAEMQSRIRGNRNFLLSETAAGNIKLRSDGRVQLLWTFSGHKVSKIIFINLGHLEKIREKTSLLFKAIFSPSYLFLY